MKLAVSSFTPENLDGLICKVTLTPKELMIVLDQQAVLSEGGEEKIMDVMPALEQQARYENSADQRYLIITLPINMLHYKQRTVVKGAYQKKEPDAAIVNAIACGWYERQLLKEGCGMQEIAKKTNQTKNVTRSRLLLTYLSPHVLEMLLAGDHPESLTLSTLYRFAAQNAN